MSVIVLASHLPGAGHFRSERYRVVGVPCAGPLDYSQAWRFLWGSKYTLVGVEHDMECSDELIDELLACPHDLCTHAYRLHHLQPPCYAHRTGKKPPCGGVWISEGDEWADFGGIGFCKIKPEARVRDLPESTWQFVDIAVGQATDARWHIHWQEGPDGPQGIEHFHH